MRILYALITDAILVVYAYAGATALSLYLGAPAEMISSLLYALAPFTAVHLVLVAAFQGYDFSKLRNESDLAFSACLGVMAGSLLAFLVSTVYVLYYTPGSQVIGRSVFAVSGLAMILVLPGWRVWYTQRCRRRGELNSRVIVVGSRETVDRVAEDLETYSRGGHEIVGCVVDDADAVSEGYLGNISDLPWLCHDSTADEVLVIGEGLPRDPSRLLRVIEACDAADLPVHILPDFYEALVGRLDLFEIGGLPLIRFRKRPLSGVYSIVKRLMDVLGAGAGLVLAAPIMLAAAVAIKLDSAGPVFYQQARTGLDGREFEIIKFRTMRVDAERETGPVLAAKNDPRVTGIGRFLRRRRIDEIPQFLNVLKGDMSLIGPRPERPPLIEEFTKNTPLFPLRLRTRPGVTSLSHVMGRYDLTPSHRLLYDMVYMGNLSLMLDLRILVATVKIVLTGRGAQ